ncbi:hypothetical protein SAMN04488057_11519 [Cyclobacterium lianum]|uniref:Uncharacterized protein n=1 Tax=Cyclobacterium lianum TaxID=388280 RepID=A0A1M7Q8B2_9BACT|nr:hypothetical protein [Cyclobacterium lianum]SHN26690.1 hypothetical protein SAMN04488057_11519 [Cyclobacterium lianum]
MKSFLRFSFCFLFLSCNLDVNRELQIDQSYEGEEAYWVSKSLDEHLHLAFYEPGAYKKKSFTDSLPGCPVVSFSEDSLSITLDYDQSNCEDTGLPDIEGSILLQYSLPSPGSTDTVHMVFQDFRQSQTSFNGTRRFRVAQKRIDNKLMVEFTDSLLLKNNLGSSTRLKPRLEHQVNYESGMVSQINTRGAMGGRNWSGNEISVDLTKTLGAECLASFIFRPSTGIETWTVLRTGAQAVDHELVYSKTGVCDTKTTIRLAEGVVMEKKP